LPDADQHKTQTIIYDFVSKIRAFHQRDQMLTAGCSVPNLSKSNRGLFPRA